MGIIYDRVDYSGRTVDLLLLKTIHHTSAASQNVGIDVSDAVGEPMIVSGVEKMVQRYALSFINAIGSTKFVYNHGTNLIPTVAVGKVYDINTLEVIAAESNLVAREQLEAADASEDTPDDERLVGSEIIGLEFSREKAFVKISVRLTTAAGSSLIYIIPVAVGVN